MGISWAYGPQFWNGAGLKPSILYLFGDEHPCASCFGVHQGTWVLTDSQITTS